ncbi:hypothetical protein PDIDSM_8138 [Penicillium digitatum]|nr:hypothetical protein PDIDSM_8138 [Penicillium digitatum]
MAVAGGGRKPNSPPETEFSKAPPKKPRNHFSTMEELAQSAREGDKPQVQVMEKVQQALNRLDQRMDSIEKATTAIKATATTPSTQTSNSNDSAAFWARLQKWGQGTGSGPPPSLPTSNGSSSIGVSPAELREDREIIVKIRDSDTAKPSAGGHQGRSSSRLRGHGSKPPGGKPVPPLVVAALLSGEGSPLWGSAHVRKPTWGVVARGIDTKTMLLTQESMAGMAKELVRQNSHSWGDTQVEILHLGWLVKPGKRREGSIIIEFTDPVVANQAITQGTLWQHQVHQTTRFCREGRSKLCLKCQKPGHVHSQCLNEYQCGHCAKQHPTWECAKQGDVEVKCANCGGGHRPTSDACEYHYLPVPTGTRYPNPRAAANCTAHDDISGSTYIESDGDRIASDRERTSSDRERIASEKEIRRMYTKVGVEKPQRRKEPSHVMRTRSRTSEDDDLPIIPEELAETASAVSQSARSLRSQNQETMQFMTDPEKQLQTSYKKRRMTAPADDMAEDYVMDEQPRTTRRYQLVRHKVAEIDEDAEEEFHDASEHSDDPGTDTNNTTTSQ